MALTPDQKYFVRIFYDKLLIIASSREILDSAQRAFEDVKCKDNPNRCSGKQTFGLVDWPDDQAKRFTSAVSEALTQALQTRVDDASLRDIHEAMVNIQTEIVPKLIVPRLRPETFEEGLRRNLPLLIADLNPVSAGRSTLSFFGGALAAGVVIAATVVISIARP